jgi:hypothetical protein
MIAPRALVAGAATVLLTAVEVGAAGADDEEAATWRFWPLGEFQETAASRPSLSIRALPGSGSLAAHHVLAVICSRDTEPCSPRIR